MDLFRRGYQALPLRTAEGTSMGTEFIQAQFNVLHKIAWHEETRNLRCVSLGRK